MRWSLPPVVRGRKISSTEISKEMVVSPNVTSVAPAPSSPANLKGKEKGVGNEVWDPKVEVIWERGLLEYGEG